MGIGRILVVVLGLAAVLGGAYYFVSGSRGRTAQDVDEQTRPAQTLQNVREAADRIEGDAQQRADELLERTE